MIRELYDARRKVVAELRSLNDSVGDREYTGEEQATADRLEAEERSLSQRLDRAIADQDREERSAQLDALVGNAAGDGNGAESAAPAYVAELRSMFNLNAGTAMDITGDLAETARVERRELNTHTGTQTGLIPTTLFGQLYEGFIREQSDSIFALSRRIVTASGEEMTFPKVAGYSVATRVGEGAANPAIAESKPSFGSIKLHAYKYGLFISVTPEFESDHAVAGVMPFVVDQAVEGVNRGLNAAFLAGDGVDDPQGLLTSAAVTQTQALSAGTLNPDSFVDATQTLRRGYRANARWILNDGSIGAIRKLKDADGRYLWQPALTAGAPDMLLGYPIVTDAAVPALAAGLTNGDAVGVFGDIQRGYITRMVGGIRVERSVEYAFLDDVVVWRFLVRADGEVMDGDALVKLTKAA